MGGLLGADWRREFKSIPAAGLVVVGADLNISKPSRPDDTFVAGFAGAVKVSSERSPSRLFSV